MYSNCLCGYNRHKTKKYSSMGVDFSVITCVGCGLSRTWPVPQTGRDSSLFYKEQEDYNDRFERIGLWRKFSARTMSFIKKQKDAGDLLDVGCNIGAFVALAQENGYNAYGIDVSEKALDLGRKKLGLSDFLLSGTIGEIEKTGKKFDAVCYSHVMEHLEKIEEELESIKKILKQDGILYIEVPNYESCWRKIFKNYWYVFSPNQHVWQFSRESLKNILEKNDLEIVIATARHSMYHELSLDIRGLLKAMLYLMSYIFNCGDNLIIIAKHK